MQDARYLKKVRGKLEEDLESRWLLERRMEMNKKLDRKKVVFGKEKDKYREVVLDEHTALVLNKTKEMDSIVTKTQKVARSILTLHHQENCREKILAEKHIDTKKVRTLAAKVKVHPKLSLQPRVENMNKLDQLIKTAMQGFGKPDRTEQLKRDSSLTASTFRSTRRSIESRSTDRFGKTQQRLASLDKENDSKCIEILW